MGDLPINPVVAGLLQGHALAQQLRRSAMEKDAYERQKLRQDWDDQRSDIEAQMMLRSAGRPVEGGMISEQMAAPYIEGMPDSIQPEPTTLYRKPDASRTVKYKTRDGQVIQSELYTPEEQQAKGEAFRQRQEEAQMMNAVRKERMLRGVRKTTIPGVGVVEDTAIPAVVAEANRKAADTRAETERQFRVSAEERNPTETRLQVRAAAGDPVARKILDRIQSDKIKVSKESRPVINMTVPGLDAQSGAVADAKKLTGDDYLKTLPAGTSAQVKAIAEGREKIPTFGSRGASALLRDAVYRYDPSFTEQRAQIRRSFTSGPDAKNIGALNTAIVHLGRLHETSEALKNGNFTPGNELFNYFKDKFGSQTVSNFTLLKDAIAGEMASALKGNATDIEIEKMGKSIRASNSPEQMMGVVREGMGILDDKAQTYKERYERDADDKNWSPILPSARGMLEKYSVKKAGGGGGGGGRTPTVNSKAEYDKLPSGTVYMEDGKQFRKP